LSASLHHTSISTDANASVGALPHSYQVTPKVLDRRRATQRKPVRPHRVDSGKEGQPAVAREPNRTGRTPPIRAAANHCVANNLRDRNPVKDASAHRSLRV
jgi:hypothetical protein